MAWAIERSSKHKKYHSKIRTTKGELSKLVKSDLPSHSVDERTQL